ncbi:MAG: ASPIC/UnbV domain-containing protein [Planctomycetota bacterium]
MTDTAKTTQGITDKACIKEETVGSDKYKQNHMGLIFQDGLSFSGFERNKFFVGDGKGGFCDLSDVSGADSEMDCRAACASDFDGDGDVDLFVNSIQRRTHLLYRNNLNSADRFVIKLRLRATTGHPDAIGATVTLKDGKTQTRVLSCGSGFESQHSNELIFGVKNGDAKTVTVLWPGGGAEEFQVRSESPGNKAWTGRYLLVEGSGKPEAIAKRSFTLSGELSHGTGMAVGRVLAKLVFVDAAGKSEAFATRNKLPTLLNFWSTTCAPCLRELPELEKLAATKKYRIRLVDMDGTKNPAQVAKILGKLAPSLAHGSLDEESLNRLFGASETSLPTTIIIEPNGRIRRIIRGVVSLDDL